jgi:hypothetical protein
MFPAVSILSFGSFILVNFIGFAEALECSNCDWITSFAHN